MNPFETWLQENSCAPFYAQSGRSKANFVLIKIQKNEKLHLLFGQKNKEPGNVLTNDFGFAGIYLCEEEQFYYVSRDFKKSLPNMGYSKEEIQAHNIADIASRIRHEIEWEIERIIDNNPENLTISVLKDEKLIYELAKLESHDTAARQARFYFDQGQPIAFIASYPVNKWNLETLLAYIDNPKEFVQSRAEEYIHFHEEEILFNLLRNERINAEYQKLLDRKEFEQPIAALLKEETGLLHAKVLEAEIFKKNRSLRFDMDARMFDGSSYTYTPASIIQPGRRNYLEIIGEEPFWPSEITALYYKGQPVYKKGEQPPVPDLPVLQEEESTEEQPADLSENLPTADTPLQKEDALLDELITDLDQNETSDDE